jgi:hypothetical protein
MLRIPVSLFALLCLSTGIAQAQRYAPTQADTAMSYTAGSPIPGLVGFTLKEALDSGSDIDRLVVFHNGEQTQSLDICTGNPVPHKGPPSDAELMSGLKGELGSISVGDFNFDNYPDLAMLVSFDEKNDNRKYCVWLFSPQTQRFVLSPELSQLTNPVPDPATNTIISNKNEDCAGQCYERETYRWSNGQLIPVKYVAQSEDPVLSPTVDCRFVRTVKEEKDGRLVSMGRQRVDIGGVPCLPHSF